MTRPDKLMDEDKIKVLQEFDPLFAIQKDIQAMIDGLIKSDTKDYLINGISLWELLHRTHEQVDARCKAICDIMERENRYKHPNHIPDAGKMVTIADDYVFIPHIYNVPDDNPAKTPT